MYGDETGSRTLRELRDGHSEVLEPAHDVC
jgi:hypothetical protein